jgi:5-methylcytosine-specific restriction enzyme A
MNIHRKAIENIYRLAVAVHHKQLSERAAVADALQQGGMSEGSARNFIRNLPHMLDGNEYKRSMNIGATEYFLRGIYSDFGSEAFKKATVSVRRQIKYYESKRRESCQLSMVKMVQRLEDEYEAG